MLQQVQATGDSAMHGPMSFGHGCSANAGWQHSVLREEWWPSRTDRGPLAEALAGTAFGPQTGGCLKEKGKAMASFSNRGAHNHGGCFLSLARHNKAVKSFALLTRTHGFAAGRLP